MNILSFDIEEWYIEKVYYEDHKEKYIEFETVLEKILNILDEENIKATFFCLGKMANDFPTVIKKINARNHEIGCHSNKHLWLTKLNRDEVFEDTRLAVEALEQCTGKKVLSYRAPAFSIGEDNKWVFEILTQCGITRDASVFPALRDFGGFASFEQKTPTIINYKDTTLKEFPVSTINLFGNEVAYSGGGYFRFFPLSFITKQMKIQPYSMTYFHIGDLLPETNRLTSKKKYEEYFKEKGTFLNRYKRYIKSNLGTKGAFNKLIELLKSTEFINLAQADASIDWDNVPKIEIT